MPPCRGDRRRSGVGVPEKKNERQDAKDAKVGNAKKRGEAISLLNDLLSLSLAFFPWRPWRLGVHLIPPSLLPPLLQRPQRLLSGLPLAGLERDGDPRLSGLARQADHQVLGLRRRVLRRGRAGLRHLEPAPLRRKHPGRQSNRLLVA